MNRKYFWTIVAGILAVGFVAHAQIIDFKAVTQEDVKIVDTKGGFLVMEKEGSWTMIYDIAIQDYARLKI